MMVVLAFVCPLFLGTPKCQVSFANCSTDCTAHDTSWYYQ